MSSDDDSSNEDKSFNSEEGPVIVPISQSEVQRIVAGQAVSDLASATKELIDNALDAGAKSINIRLFNQGVDVLEVSDDGCGVPRHSRPLLAMKHATSKIRSFNELYEDRSEGDATQRANQLGFRGEALFCLANISSNLVVSTRTKTDELGQRFEFRRDGYMDPKSVVEVARKVGTTVAVVKLFGALPVRRVDMKKRIKAQRAKLIRMVQSYSILCVGVRFNLIDITGPIGSPNCKTETKMSTSEKSESFKQTVSSILGSKFLAGLCELNIDLTSVVEKLRKEKGKLLQEWEKKLWKVTGLISKAPDTGDGGKVARELQFISLNGRPVEMPKVSRVLSDAWKSFDALASIPKGASKRRPACVLLLTLPNSMYDVNLSPDKREVLLTEEDSICSVIYDALVALWSSQSDGKFKANEVENMSNDKKRNADTMQQKTLHLFQEKNSTNLNKKRNVSKINQQEQNINYEDEEAKSLRLNKNGKMKRRNACVNRFDNIGMACPDTEPINHVPKPKNMSPEQLSPEVVFQQATNICRLKQLRSRPSQLISKDVVREIKDWEELKKTFNCYSSKAQVEEISKLEKEKPTGASNKNVLHKNNNVVEPNAINGSLKNHSFVKQSRNNKQTENSTISEPICEKKTSEILNTANEDSSMATKISVESNEGIRKQPDPSKVSRSESKSIDDSENTLKLKPTQKSQQIVWSSFTGTEQIIGLARKSKIQKSQNCPRLLNKHDEVKDGKNPEQGKSCPERTEETSGIKEVNLVKSNEKTVSLSKDDFLKMTVVGQFNLGFILACCKKNNLWILDQHACDEIYNFEKIAATTKFHEQKLIAPLPLELSPSEEDCILENMELFQDHGFRFQYYSNKPPRHRLALTALPHSGSGGDGRKAVQFGKEDVGAFCAILGADGESSSGIMSGSGTGADGSGSSGNNAVRRFAGSNGGTIIRLPKVVAMFASRACRSSVMIGDALSHEQMQKIVQKLHQVEQPWNCPHGRPTMRHVKNISQYLEDDEKIEPPILPF